MTAGKGDESSIKSAEDFKDAGNKAFQCGDLQAALEYYTTALELEPDGELKATLYRNRAIVKLKLEDYEGCETDATRGL